MATALEYGLIAAGISVAIISVVNGFGDKLPKTTFKPAAQTTTTRPADWEKTCSVYNGLKDTRPEEYAYLQKILPHLARCNS
jgi:Flp pilus assembly pilin Flp